MNREQKHAMMTAVKPTLVNSHIYLLDCEGLKANQMHALRSMLYKEQIQCKLVPNSLLKILLADIIPHSVEPLLKKTSLVLSTKKNPSAPAKIIKLFHEKHNTSTPYLKGAWVHQELFVGKEHITTLTQLRSKEELIADVIALLQAPTAQLLAALQYNNNQLANIVKTLAEK